MRKYRGAIIAQCGLLMFRAINRIICLISANNPDLIDFCHKLML